MTGKKYPFKDRGELRLRSVPEPIRKKLDNIADNLGMTTNDFVKKNLHKIIETFPPQMCNPVIVDK